MPSEMLLAFFTALFTGITLGTPPSAWITVGLTGMIGWFTRGTLAGQNFPELVANLAGAMVMGASAEIFARVQKHPVTVYIVSGIIPLVPGITAYNAMLHFLVRDFNQGLLLAFRAILIASYLAAGLAIVPLVLRNFKKICRRRRSRV